jgi:hypothetical protein
MGTIMAPPFVPAPIYNGVASATTLLTSLGSFPISELVGQQPVVWNGVAWEQALIEAGGTDQPMFQVNLADGRSLNCSASYLWYVQNEYYTAFTPTPTSELAPGSSILWRTQQPTDSDYNTGTFPTVSAITALTQNDNLYYLTTSTGLAVLNGILAGVGGAAQGLPNIAPSPAPTPAPAPSPTPWPWVPPGPSPTPIPSAVTFSYSNASGNPLQVSLNGLLTDPNAVVVNWRWDLGDGFVGTTQNVVHTYAMNATYVVRLTVTYADGKMGVAEGKVSTMPAVVFPPSPTPSPAPTPSGYVEPVVPAHSDSFYLGALENGVPVAINGLVTSSNGDYVQDPYFNFELPAGATNISVVLSADSAGNFQNADGWLIVRRGDRPSSNDQDLTTNDYTAESPNAQNAYGIGVAELSETAGEWFASLDVSSSSTISNMSIVASWTHPIEMPSTQTVTNGNNGTLSDGADFLFTIPAAPSGGGDAIAYWSISVPAGYTLGVVLDDNSNGDLVGQLSDEDVALILTTEGHFPAPMAGIADTAVPFGVYYYNSTTSAVEIFVNVGNANTATYPGVRLLLSLTPASATTQDSAAPTLIDLDTVLTNAGVYALTSLSSPVQDWVEATEGTYTLTGDSSQVTLANAASVWAAILNQASSIAGSFASGGSATPQATLNQSLPNSSATSENVVISLYYGYCPFYYATWEDSPGVVLQAAGSNIMLEVSSPALLYAREVVILAMDVNGNVQTQGSKSFFEMAYLGQGIVPSQFIVDLLDANENVVGTLTTQEQVNLGSSNGYDLYVYRADMSSIPTGAAYSSLVNNGVPIATEMANYLTLFSRVAAQNGSVATPLKLSLSIPV